MGQIFDTWIISLTVWLRGTAKCLCLLPLVLVLRIWSCLHHWPTCRSQSKSAQKCIRTAIVCKMLSRSVEIWQYKGQKTCFGVKTEGPSVCKKVADIMSVWSWQKRCSNMNCDLWSSHGRIFAQWPCLYFSMTSRLAADRPSTFSYMIRKADLMARKSSPVSVRSFLAPWLGS